MSTTTFQVDDLRPEFRPDAVVRFYGEEAIAWAPDVIVPVYFDPLVALVHQFFDGQTRLGEIADDVHEVIGVPASVAQARLGQIVDLLDGHRLLTNSAVQAIEFQNSGVLPGPPNP